MIDSIATITGHLGAHGDVDTRGVKDPQEHTNSRKRSPPSVNSTEAESSKVHVRKWITEGTMDVCVITANTLSVRSVRKGSEQMYPMAPEERAGTARKLKKEIARRHWVKGHPFQPLLARLESPRPLRRRGGEDARMSGYTISFSCRA